MQYLDKNVEQIRAELKEIEPIIEGTEFAMDYGHCPTKEEYEKYEEAIKSYSIMKYREENLKWNKTDK